MACGVGVIGAGTVGSGVIHTLLTNGDAILDQSGQTVRLRHVADLNLEPLKAFDLSGVTVSTDAKALIHDPDVSVVCELIGGVEPAKTFILEALRAGKNVVTANKMLLALHARELNEVAIENGVDLRYEAAVAGTIPIIKALREGLAANHIQAIYGIMNGTCNYILTRMSLEDLPFDAVLQQAMAAGFAETPPDLDIEGHDTAHKCTILASLAYSTPVKLDDLYVEGITGITRQDVAYTQEMGYQVKLLAVIRKVDGEIEARVNPTLVPEDHLLAAVKYEFNAIYVESDIADATLYYGRGAGKLPTASAVVADVVDIARRDGAPAPVPFRYAHEWPVREMGLLCGQYYLRIVTEDKPGVLGTVCGILGEHGVSIASCTQKDEHGPSPVNVVLMTHETTEAQVKAALAEIDALAFITEPAHLIRVL